MNLRLVYIREEDLQERLVRSLNSIHFKDVKVLFFIELKEVDEKVIPMISDLSKLRLRKAESRIREWLTESVPHIKSFEVLVFDGRPTRYNPSYQLLINGDEGIQVFLDPKHELRIAPYLKHHAGAHQIKYMSLGDFSDQDLNN